jgi:hypothetical protein
MFLKFQFCFSFYLTKIFIYLDLYILLQHIGAFCLDLNMIYQYTHPISPKTINCIPTKNNNADIKEAHPAAVDGSSNFHNYNN